MRVIVAQDEEESDRQSAAASYQTEWAQLGHYFLPPGTLSLRDRDVMTLQP
jgi:hypothetical protein